MSNKLLENLVLTTRLSVIEQLRSANMLFDVVRELTNVAERLPPEQKTLLENEALKIYEQASAISESAAKMGNDLAKAVGG